MSRASSYFAFLVAIQCAPSDVDGGNKDFISVKITAGDAEAAAGDSLEEINKKINAPAEEKSSDDADNA